MSEKQASLDFKCRKILGGVDEKSIVCQTPEKISEPLHSKSNAGKILVPDKCVLTTECKFMLKFMYKALAVLFDSMNCSLRLLNLCQKSATFKNVSTQVESLSKRKFLYKHLAQIIYILPEVVLVHKILVHDKKTLCMKPDIKITLSFDVVNGHCEESPYTALRKVFASRLIDFSVEHPQATDVPEAKLPEPFCKSFLDTIEDTTGDSFLKSPSLEEVEEKFDPYVNEFCNRSKQQKDSTVSSYSKCYDLSIQETETDLKKEASSTSSKPHPSCPVQLISTESHVVSSSSTSESPAVKFNLNSDNVMTETPVQSTPRRLIPTPDVHTKVDTPGHQLKSSSKPAKRVLDFSRSEVDETVAEKIGFSSMSQTTRGFILDDEVNKSIPSKQVQDSSCCFHDVSNKIKAELGRNQQISSLSDLVAVIHSVFVSVSCTTITKEELLHKIIMNSLDFTDQREAEEQVELLEKVVPHWICKKLLPSGDIIYSIDRSSNLDSVQSRLFNHVIILE